MQRHPFQDGRESAFAKRDSDDEFQYSLFRWATTQTRGKRSLMTPRPDGINRTAINSMKFELQSLELLWLNEVGVD